MVSPTEAKALASRPVAMSFAGACFAVSLSTACLNLRLSRSSVAAMAVSGPAPELVNARLAMLGFAGAAGAELQGAGPVLAQATAYAPQLAALVFVVSLASLVPLMSGSKRQRWGPFTSGAELALGRSAMIGMASLLALETLYGNTLF